MGEKRKRKQQVEYITKEKAFEEAIPSLDILQTRLEQGAVIRCQDDHWILFDKEGEMICIGKSIRQMLMNLIFTDC